MRLRKPHSRAARLLITCGACCALLSCDARGLASSGPVASPEFSVGPNPELPEPAAKRLIPTVIIAEASGWRGDETPTPSADLHVNAFATQLAHPRWLYVLPNGDVLVAETNAPARPEENKGLRAMVMGRVMAKAGAGTPSANRITLLRDADGDGVAEFSSVFLDQLTSPFGMALIGSDLYVANTDSIIRFRYQPGQTKIDARGIQLTALPAGTRNHHWTKNIIASVDGTKLYASVGSNSNVAENGMDVEEGRAAVWEVDVKTGAKQLFATGLRNPNGMAWEPTTGELWTVVNERDELGNDLVPDYLTTVKAGRFYGWPYSYFGQHVDVRVEPQRPELVASASPPDYALGAHVAALGLSYAGESALPRRFREGMFIGEHGSWNRDPPVGYKVVFVPFSNGKPSGPPIDVLGGFVTAQGEARGRPVGVVMDSKGALLVADDVGNTVWRVTGARQETATSSR